MILKTNKHSKYGVSLWMQLLFILRKSWDLIGDDGMILACFFKVLKVQASYFPFQLLELDQSRDHLQHSDYLKLCKYNHKLWYHLYKCLLMI